MEEARRRRDLAKTPAERLALGFRLSHDAFELLGPAGQKDFIAKQRSLRAVKTWKAETP